MTQYENEHVQNDTLDTQEQEEAKVYDMSFFLPNNEAEAEEEKAIITRRYLDKNKEPIPFVFKAITTERIEELQKQFTNVVTKGSRRGTKNFDSERYSAKVAIETTIYPDFKNKDLLKAHKTGDPIVAAKKMLTFGGEYSNWIDKAMTVNGYGEEVEDIEEEAKN